MMMMMMMSGSQPASNRLWTLRLTAIVFHQNGTVTFPARGHHPFLGCTKWWHVWKQYLPRVVS